MILSISRWIQFIFSHFPVLSLSTPPPHMNILHHIHQTFAIKGLFRLSRFRHFSSIFKEPEPTLSRPSKPSLSHLNCYYKCNCEKIKFTELFYNNNWCICFTFTWFILSAVLINYDCIIWSWLFNSSFIQSQETTNMMTLDYIENQALRIIF